MGNLLLTGTKKALAKPFVITERVQPRADKPLASDSTIPSSFATASGTCGEARPEDDGKVSLRVVGVVRHRVLFSVRPKPIITSLPPSVIPDATHNKIH